MLEPRDHPQDATDDGFGAKNDGIETAVNAIPSETVLNWSAHLKNMQAIIGDKQNEVVEIDKCKSNLLKQGINRFRP